MEIFDGRYEQEKLLGEGAFSEVWKVRDQQTGVTLALKIFNAVNGLNEDGNEMLTHEFALMVNASHKNLLRPLFFATCGNRPYLILPYCEQGNIGKMVGRMTETEAWKLIRDCASALAYLHNLKPPILHQDIKPANILLSNNGDYMLTDFGVSTQAKESLSRVSNQEKVFLSAGTISYMAPERFTRQNLPIMANDIYSLGSTVYEMLSGKLPFGNDGGLLQKKGADVPELPGDFSPLMKCTLEKCLDANPWARPKAEVLEDVANNALKHPETRNQIPEVLHANNPDQVSDGWQKSAQQAEIQAKKTILGPAIDERIKDTIIFSPNSHKSAKTHSSYNSYYPDEPDGEKFGGWLQKKKLWIGLAIAVILAVVGAGVYLSTGNDISEEKASEVSLDPLEQQKLKEEADYQHAMALFNKNNPDSALTALHLMKELAEKGNPKAIFEMARTYAWTKDPQSNSRKRLLGLSIYEDGPSEGRPISSETNQEAIKWLKRSIETTKNDYRSMYWLAFYYLNGLCVKQDINQAKDLLKRALEEAKRDPDPENFKEKIEEILSDIQKII